MVVTFNTKLWRRMWCWLSTILRSVITRWSCVCPVNHLFALANRKKSYANTVEWDQWWNTVEHQGSWHWYNDKRLRLQSRINTLKKLNRRYDSFKMIQVKLRQLKLETSLVWKMAQSTSRTLTRPWRKYASPPAGVTHLNGHLSRVDSVPRWNLNLEPGFSDFQMLLTLTTLWCIN